MNRLRKWFEDHSIFERWDNPKYEGKLKDAIKDAGKDKGRTAGREGFSTLGVLLALTTAGGAAALFPEMSQHLPSWLSGLGLLGLLGTLSPSDSTPEDSAVVDKIFSSDDDTTDVVVVFSRGTREEDAAALRAIQTLYGMRDALYGGYGLAGHPWGITSWRPMREPGAVRGARPCDAAICRPALS
jgi:hypothetical protein